MTEIAIQEIPNATAAHQQSSQNLLDRHNFKQKVLAQLNARINIAIEKGRFDARLDWIIPGAGVADQYRDISNTLQRYYRDRGYDFETVEGYYKVSW